MPEISLPETLADTNTAARRLGVSPSKRPRARTDAVSSASENMARDTPEMQPPIHELDKPRTYEDAADALGVPYHVVQRAARRGLVPTYRLGTSRRYVKLRDFFDLMDRGAKPSRDIVLPLAGPTDATQAAPNSLSAALSNDDASRSGGAK